jgi:transmembrane sensor
MTGRQTAAEIEEAATRWVVRLDAGAADETDHAELAQWLASDSRCRGALLQAEAAWLALDAMRGDDAGAPPAPDDSAADRRSAFPRRTVLAGMVGALAASVAGVFLVGRRADVYETTVGEVRRIPLADRSTMAVNTASRIEVAYTSTRRGIAIDRGEAWFQVRKDPAKPFVVSAGPVRVEAVGTAFSVRRRDGGADVMVTEGVVRVWVDGREDRAVSLAAGAALFVSDTAGMRPEPTLAPAIERRLAWRSGQINLEGETLGEAVQEFNRYSATPIVVRDPDVAGRRLYGVFRLDDPGGFARTAAVTLGVAAWTQDDRIVIARTRH